MLMKTPLFRGLDDFFFNSKRDDFARRYWVPSTTTETTFPMDILERDGEYEVRIAIPGADRDTLSVTVDNGSLHVEASDENEKESAKDTTYVFKGLESFRYKRTIPNISKYGIQQDEITSVYKNGILSVVLPKSEEVKPKIIDVKIEA
jgi:HSP20 family protein